MKKSILFFLVISILFASCVVDRDHVDPCASNKKMVGYGPGGWGRHRTGKNNLKIF
ncbi:MAG TPA: hypothetical protein VIM77_10365 [Mucilaginibacter sp.]